MPALAGEFPNVNFSDESWPRHAGAHLPSCGVDGPGFHVEPDMLEGAAQGMTETVADQDAVALDTVPGPPDRYGHDGVCAALVESCGAWTVGVDALCDRGRRNGTSLREAAQANRDADARTADALTVDPATAVVDPVTPPPR